MRLPIVPTFIDFEASSLDLVASYPIEVGICRGDGYLDSWLIRPFVLWKDWSPTAQDIHGLSPELLQADGLEISQVAEQLNQLLPPVVYCDAWTFDSFWLHRLYKPTQLQPAFQLEPVSALLDERQCQRWAETRAAVIDDLRMETHRAANDAFILQETWRRVTGAGG